MNKVLIDTDAGADDLIAIILAMLSPETKVEAIITSYGNYLQDESTERVQVLLNYLDLTPLPEVIQGSLKPLQKSYFTSYDVHGKNVLKQENKAKKDYVVGLDQLLRGESSSSVFHASNGPLIYICIGPLTNLAKILRSSLAMRIKNIIIVGGALNSPGNATPLSEANFYWDPHAVLQVLTSNVPIFLISLNHTEQLSLRYRDIKGLKYAKFISSFFAPYVKFYTNSKKYYFDPIRMKSIPYTGGALHDPAAILSLVNSKIITFQPIEVALNRVVSEDGFIYPVVNRAGFMIDDNDIVRLKVASSFDVDRFWHSFHELLSA